MGSPDSMKGLHCSSMYFIAFWSKFQAPSFGKGGLQTWVLSCSPYVPHNASTLWSQGLLDHRASLSATCHTQTYTPLSMADSSAFKVHLITPFPYSSATAHRFLCRSTICGSFILLIYALGGCPLQPFPNCPCQEVWDNFLFSITVFSAPIIIVGTQ